MKYIHTHTQIDTHAHTNEQQKLIARLLLR